MVKKQKPNTGLAPSPRYRVTGGLTSFPPTYHQRYYPASCVLPRAYTAWDAYRTSPIGFGEFKSITDWVNTGYSEKRRRGEWLATYPLAIFVTKGSHSGISNLRYTYLTTPACTAPIENYFDEFEGNILPYRAAGSGYGSVNFINPPERMRSVFDETATRCMAGRDRGKANYFETLAEIDQLWHMMGNPIENLSRFFTNILKSNSYQRLEYLRRRLPGQHAPFDVHGRFVLKPPKKVNVLGEVQKLIVELNALWTAEYLRYRYGVKPILSDIEAAKTALSHGYPRTPTLHTSRSSGGFGGDRQTPFTLSDSVKNAMHTWVRTDTESYTVKHGFTDEYVASELRELGFTLANVVGLPWELTRLSFVADWIGNIGDFIYANIPRVNVNPKGGFSLEKYQCISIWHSYGISDIAPFVWHADANMAETVQHESYQTRRYDINPGAAGLVLKGADQKWHPGWTRVADAVAIAVQQARKIRLW